MPGGMGGGMGGMGGGLLGGLMRGAMGGMNRNPSGNQTQTAESFVDDYDVARWQRADGLDVVPTMVQTVRADWDRKEAEKKERFPIKKLLSKLSRKKEPKAAAFSEPEPRPTGGTIVTPEMKKASQRISTAAEREAAAKQTEPPKRRTDCGAADRKNYLGLHFPSELDGFFTANPVNSAILAVDSLGMGALTLNQVMVPPEPEALPDEMPRDRADQPLSGHEQTGDPQRTDTNYMNEFRRSREQQKYNVRIRE